MKDWKYLAVTPKTHLKYQRARKRAVAEKRPEREMNEIADIAIDLYNAKYKKK